MTGRTISVPLCVDGFAAALAGREALLEDEDAAGPGAFEITRAYSSAGPAAGAVASEGSDVMTGSAARTGGTSDEYRQRQDADAAEREQPLLAAERRLARLGGLLHLAARVDDLHAHAVEQDRGLR